LNDGDCVIEIEKDSALVEVGTENKKQRLLIGKNIEKKPDLSYSTLEPVRSQLNSIIADATQQMKLQDELEMKELKNAAAAAATAAATITIPNVNNENITKILPSACQNGEILTVNGNLMNGVILTMNRNNLPNTNIINPLPTNTAPLNIITPVCNNMTNVVSANNNLVNLTNSNVNGQPIFLTDFMGGTPFNVNNNATLLNIIKNNMNINTNQNSLPVIIAPNNSQITYSNILPKPANNMLTKISPCPEGYLKSALSTSLTHQSKPQRGRPPLNNSNNNNNNNNNNSNESNVNRRTKNNICNLIPNCNSVTNLITTPSTTASQKSPPKKSIESTEEEASKKRPRTTIKNIFDQTQHPIEKKFRNSRIVTIDPPDPATLIKLNELALVKDANRKDVHDEISDMFNLSEDQQRKSNVTRSNSNLEELIRKNLSPPKEKNKEATLLSKNLTSVKQEPKEYSDQEDSEDDEMTTSANDDGSDDSDYELVLQLNRESKKLAPNKNSKINSNSLNNSGMNGKSKKALEQVCVKIENCLNEEGVNNNCNNRSLRSRTSLNKK
jgi:hypothetical protein